MSEERIKTVQDAERGCGWRKEGGFYMMGGGESAHCDRLPLGLEICPVCSSGIKVSRGYTWINPAEFIKHSIQMGKAKPCELKHCGSCPLGGAAVTRAGLFWIGEQFYPDPRDFSQEAAILEISRRIQSIPTGFKVGETWIFLAHRKTFSETCEPCIGTGFDQVSNNKKCDVCHGEGKNYRAGIFHAFRPDRIEYIVKGDESDEYLDKLIERGITPVRVEKVTMIEKQVLQLQEKEGKDAIK